MQAIELYDSKGCGPLPFVQRRYHMPHAVRNSRRMDEGQPENNAVSVYPILVKKHKVTLLRHLWLQRKSGCDPASSVEFERDEITCIGTGTEVECLIDDEDAVVSSTTWMDEPLAERLFDILLLISPFFFWGTSMVVMKVRNRKIGIQN